MDTIDNSNNIETKLQKQLKETSLLSDNEINEIVPKILELINLKENIENKQTETSTQNFLLDLRQDITNNSNVAIDIKKNKGTVIGTIEVNNIRNDIHITVNVAPNLGEQQKSEENPNPEEQQKSKENPNPEEQQKSEENPNPEEQQKSEENPNPEEQQKSKENPNPEEQQKSKENPNPEEQQKSKENPNPEEQQKSKENPNYRQAEISGLQAETGVDLQQLQQEIQTPNIDYSKIRTADDLLSVLDQLLDEIQNIEQGISKKSVGSTGREGIKSAKTKLKQYKEKIKGKKKSLEKAKRKGSHSQIFESDINEVKNLESNIKKVSLDLSRHAWNESSNESGFLYNSPENARKSNIQQERLNEFEALMKEEVKKGAILRIFNGQEKEATDFYRKIAEGRYGDSEYNTYTTNATILNPSFQRCGINIPILTPSQIQTMGGISGMGQQSIQAIDIRSINRGQGTPEGGVPLEQGTQTISQRKPKIDYSNMDLGEAFKVGGLAGVLDKALSNCKNMTPGQRDAWKSIGVLGAYAAGIFGLYKFFTNKDMSFRGKAGITATAIFGAQALTGEGPLSLFNKAIIGGFSADELQDKLGNAFGDAVTGVSNSGMECAPTLSGSMYSMMIFNATTTVGDIRALTASFRDNNEWKTFRENAINKLKNMYGENSAQYFSTNFPEIFDEQKRNAWLASFGITSTAPDNTTNVYEIANNASMNELIIEKFKEENGLKETDVEVKKKEFHNYIDNLKNNNQALNIQTLKAHQDDWFKDDTEARYTIREIDKQNIKALENQVENLPISDPQKKSELKTAIVRFYNERSINTKPILSDFSLKMENNLLILSSHGEKAKIKINTNEIHDFGNGISFSDLSELLNVADLSNKILETQKGKQPKDLPPFQYKIGRGGRGIYFNDAEGWNFNFDTRVLSGGRGGAIGKIDTLSQHSDDFAKYLSKRREENNKINLDSYTILKEVGITFINKDEATKSEELLEYIKNELRMYEKRDVGTAFEISTEITTKTYIKFFTRGGETKKFDISDYPTFKNNKDQLLKYLNNPSNKMRESQRPI